MDEKCFYLQVTWSYRLKDLRDFTRKLLGVTNDFRKVAEYEYLYVGFLNSKNKRADKGIRRKCHSPYIEITLKNDPNQGHERPLQQKFQDTEETKNTLISEYLIDYCKNVFIAKSYVQMQWEPH